MSEPSEDNGTSTSSELGATKAKLEIDKLRAEIRQLSRPFLRQPASWIALFTLGLSLFANAIQLSSAERQRQLAEIRKERLDYDAMILDDKVKNASAELTQAQAAIAKAKLDFDKQRDLLAALERDIASGTATREAIREKISQIGESSSNSSEAAATLLTGLLLYSLVAQANSDASAPSSSASQPAKSIETPRTSSAKR